MVSMLQRVAPSVLAFIAAAGLQVSGFQDMRLALALWAFAALWGIIAVATWQPVRARLPRVPYTIAIQRTTKRNAPMPSPAVAEKGFLDFIIEFQEGSTRLTRSVAEIARETAKMGENIGRHTQGLTAARSNPNKAQRIASKAASDMDRFSSFVERSLPNLKSYSEGMTGGWASYLKWKLANTGLTAAEREEVRTATTTFREASRSGRSGIKSMRDSAQRLRDTAVSQEVNRATEYRLLPALDDLMGTLRSLERSCLDILRMVRESSSGAPSAGRRPARRRR